MESSAHTPDTAPRETGRETGREMDDVDEASEQSFPASDPPSWDPLHVGAPDGTRVPEEAPAPRQAAAHLPPRAAQHACIRDVFD